MLSQIRSLDLGFESAGPLANDVQRALPPAASSNAQVLLALRRADLVAITVADAGGLGAVTQEFRELLPFTELCPELLGGEPAMLLQSAAGLRSGRHRGVQVDASPLLR